MSAKEFVAVIAADATLAGAGREPALGAATGASIAASAVAAVEAGAGSRSWGARSADADKDGGTGAGRAVSRVDSCCTAGGIRGRKAGRDDASGLAKAAAVLVSAPVS